MEYATKLSGFLQVFEPEPLNEETLELFYYDGTMPIRMNDEYVSPLNDIFVACTQVRRQNAHLLLGHRGCGKSTELNLLKQRLEHSGRSVEIIQCQIETDLIGLTYWDLLILMGKHLCEIAQTVGCRLPEQLLDNIDNFWKEEENIYSEVDNGNIAIEAEVSASTPKILKIVQFFAGLSGELKFGYEKRNTIREKVKKNTAQWIGYVTEVSEYITKQQNGKQPILIFEDLDKLPPDKAWEVFSNPLSQMPFPIIFTFPISLSYDPKFTGLSASFNSHYEILPMIKIRNIDGEQCLRGINAIKEIVKRRASLYLFTEDALTLLIEKTGGILRDLFHCITESANRAENRKSGKVELEDAQYALTQLRSSLTRRIETRNYKLLKNIYKGGKYKSQIEDKAMLLEMMEGLIVLEYNGDRWHDLHPLVEDFLREQEVL